MKAYPRPLYSCGKSTRRTRCAAATGLGLLLVMPAAALRAGDPTLAGDATEVRTAANQSVGIDEPALKTPPGGADDAVTKPTVEPVPASQAASGVTVPPRGEKRLRAPDRTYRAQPVADHPSAITGLWPLVAVMALIGALYFFVRRFKGNATGAASGAMRVLSRLNLSPRHQLALVQVGQKVLVVGVSATDVRTLYVVDDSEEAAMLAAGGTRSEAFFEELSREGAGFAAGEEETPQAVRRGAGGISDLLKRVRAMQSP